MEDADDLEVQDTQSLRAHRLSQISSLTFGALAIAALFYAYSSRWLIVSILGGGMALMLLCRQLSRKGQTDLGNLVLLLSVSVMMSTLMWIAQGLRDAAFLTYPVILILAGLLVLATHVPLGRQVLKRGIVFIDLAVAQIAALGVIAADSLETFGLNLAQLSESTLTALSASLPPYCTISEIPASILESRI